MSTAYTPPATPDFFVRVPTSLVRCPGLPPAPKALYDLLLSYADAAGYVYAG